MEGLKALGFSSFRPGQREVVLRILSGHSSLMITATGSGKSLCYQLPAYLYRHMKGRGTCFTLVVSPLVSLMDDQVLRLPSGLKGACLHTNKTHLQKDRVFQDLAKGKVDILYLSPEALVGGVLWSRGSGRGHGSLKDMPPIAFACIDEVHCISEWSHNFRPSYLRLYKVSHTAAALQIDVGLTVLTLLIENNGDTVILLENASDFNTYEVFKSMTAVEHCMLVTSIIGMSIHF